MKLANINQLGSIILSKAGEGGAGGTNIATLDAVGDIFVPYRTAFGLNGAGVGLPASIGCSFDGGGSGTVDITWAIGSYNSGAQGSTVAVYDDAVYNIVGTPVLAGGITNTGNITATCQVTVRDIFHPLTSGIAAIWDFTQLVNNSTNAFGTVNGSGAITSVLSQAPGPIGRNLVNTGIAPQLSGGRAVFIGTGAFEEANVTTDFDFMHYNATAANLKWTVLMGVNPTDTGVNYGIMGDNGFSAALDGFCITINTETTKTGIATKITGNGANVFNAFNDNFLAIGSEQIITAQVDNALANGSGRVKHLTNLTSTNNTILGAGTLDSGSAGKLQIGDAGGISALEMTGTLSVVVILNGVELDAVRNQLISDLAFYTTGVTI